MVDFLLVFSDDLWTVRDTPGFLDIWFITRKRIVLPRRFTMSHRRAMPRQTIISASRRGHFTL